MKGLSMEKIESLAQLLELERGITALVGGGGKTSLLYKLARELADEGYKVIITTTTKIFHPEKCQVDSLLIEPSLEEIEEKIEKGSILGLSGPKVQGKLTSLDLELFPSLVDLADYILVEADGAKMLPLKVPGQYEPVIPASTSRVLILLGLSALGQPLGKVCFRSARAAEILGKDENQDVTFQDLLALVEDERGLSKGSQGIKTSLVFNQRDLLDKKKEDQLREEFSSFSRGEVFLISIKEKRYEKLC